MKRSDVAAVIPACTANERSNFSLRFPTLLVSFLRLASTGRWSNSPKYQSSHFPEKANTGLFKDEVICPTLEKLKYVISPKKRSGSHLPEMMGSEITALICS